MMRSLILIGAIAVASPAFGDILFDNGPMSTGPIHSKGTSAPAGTEWSELQTEAGVGTNGTLGYSVNYTNTTGIGTLHQADDFTVTGSWTITDVIAYGFRSGGSTTESFLSGVVQIWDGVPGATGSSVIAGDLTTNVLTNTAFTNLYRTGRSSGSTTRPIMAATLHLNTPITLTAGTYWMDYGLEGISNTYAPLVTIPGQITRPGANGMLFTSGQWYTMEDSNSGVQLEVPFQLIGQPVPEPATLAVLGLGALLLRRKRSS